MQCYLIEDDIATQFVLSTQLNRLDFKTKIFPDVSEFEQLLQKTPSHLEDSWLLVDINLPVEDGDKFLIRKREELSRIRGLRIVLLQESSQIPALLQQIEDVTACSKEDIFAFMQECIS